MNKATISYLTLTETNNMKLKEYQNTMANRQHK